MELRPSTWLGLAAIAAAALVAWRLTRVAGDVVGAVGDTVSEWAGDVQSWVGNGLTELDQWAGNVQRQVIDGAVLVTPTSPENLAYRGVNQIGSAITGDARFDLGNAIYDWTH